MSPALYRTRLYWAGLRGYALLDGRVARLAGPPRLPGLPELRVDAIDWCPCVHVAMVMPKFHGGRDLTAQEIAAAQQFLRDTVPADAPLLCDACIPGTTADARGRR